MVSLDNIERPVSKDFVRVCGSARIFVINGHPEGHMNDLTKVEWAKKLADHYVQACNEISAIKDGPNGAELTNEQVTALEDEIAVPAEEFVKALTDRNIPLGGWSNTFTN